MPPNVVALFCHGSGKRLTHQFPGSQTGGTSYERAVTNCRLHTLSPESLYAVGRFTGYGTFVQVMRTRISFGFTASVLLGRIPIALCSSQALSVGSNTFEVPIGIMLQQRFPLHQHWQKRNCGERPSSPANHTSGNPYRLCRNLHEEWQFLRA